MKKTEEQIKSYLKSHKVRFSATINLIKAFLLGAEIEIDVDNYLKKTVSPTDKIVKLDDFIEWYKSPIPFELQLGDFVKVKSLDWYNDNKNNSGTIVYDNGVDFVESMAKFCGKEYTICKREHSSLFCNVYTLRDKESGIESDGFVFSKDMLEL